MVQTITATSVVSTRRHLTSELKQLERLELRRGLTLEQAETRRGLEAALEAAISGDIARQEAVAEQKVPAKLSPDETIMALEAIEDRPPTEGEVGLALEALERKEVLEMAEAVKKAALIASASLAEAKATKATEKAEAAKSKTTKVIRTLETELVDRRKRQRQEAAVALKSAGSLKLSAAVAGDGSVSLDEAIRLLNEAEMAARSTTSPMGSLWFGIVAALDAAYYAQRQEAANRQRNWRARG